MFHLFFHSRQMEGEKSRRGREGGKENQGCFLSFFFSLSFFLESKLNLNSVLPYADLRRNVPYALEFIREAILEANTE